MLSTKINNSKHVKALNIRPTAIKLLEEIIERAPAGVAQMVGLSSHRPKGHGFDFQSGDIPRLWFNPWWGHLQESTQWMFLSDINVFLSFFLPNKSNHREKAPLNWSW